MEIKDAACRSTRTPSSRSGRASSSRATSSSTSSRARPARRSCDAASTIPDGPDRGAGAARPDADSLQSDTRAGPAEAAPGLRRARSTASPPRARTATRSRSTQGETAGGVAERLARLRAGRAARQRRIVNEALLGTELARPLEAGQRASRRSPRRSSRNEAQLKDLITNFNRTTAAFAAEQDNLRADDRAAAAGARAGQPGVRRAERRVPADARVRARDPARRPRDARPRSRRRSRGSSRSARSCRPPSSRAS